jgi:hypothetical protein
MTGPGGAGLFHSAATQPAVVLCNYLSLLGLARRREDARAPEPSSVGIEPLAKAPRGAMLLRRSERSVPQTFQKILEDLPLPRK